MSVPPRRLISFALIPAVLLLARGGAAAQEVPAPPAPAGISQQPRVSIAYPSPMTREAPVLDAASTSPTPRLRLVGMPTGYLASPFGLPDTPASSPREDAGLLDAGGP